MKILITNDDSHRSPLLEIAVDFFSQLGSVTLVVPLHEQSWTGKSMTRFSTVVAHSVDLLGRKATSVSGTPADAINLAIRNLLDEPPDLVVSGINAGFNIGLGFILSSGTVGACIEANLAGVPAIALSQAFDSETRNRYMADYAIAPETVARFRTQAFGVLSRFTEVVLSDEHRQDFLREPITWNINFPYELVGESKLHLAPLGQTRYGQVFHPQNLQLGDDGEVYQHGKVELIHDTNPACDSSVIGRGQASLSVLDCFALAGRKAVGVEEIVGKFRGG